MEGETDKSKWNTLDMKQSNDLEKFKDFKEIHTYYNGLVHLNLCKLHWIHDVWGARPCFARSNTFKNAYSFELTPR